MVRTSKVLRTAIAASLIATLLSAVAGSAKAALSPVRCAAGDVTVDGRVFPEPKFSGTFLSFEEFVCGIEFLESQHPNLIEITTPSESVSGLPVYDVILTDERSHRYEKRDLLIVSSIHGNEIGAREGAGRVIEDIVDAKYLAKKDWVEETLDKFNVHFLFPNPDGWVNGDVQGTGAGMQWTRGNDTAGMDLNRNFPVQGWIDRNNRTLTQPESQGIDAMLKKGDWFLGTDNHGQSADTYAAAGLQIVGQFNYQKSETLASFADSISDAMAEVDVYEDLEELNKFLEQDMGAYHWGTLYDMLGYSASGSLIDYYNTAEGINGTGYATELTAGQMVNRALHPTLLNQLYVDLIRAINYSLFKNAINPKQHTFPVRSRAAYIFDPDRIRHDDENGAGYERQEGEDIPQRPYDVSRMEFFSDLNDHSSRDVKKVTVGDVVQGDVDLDHFGSVILTTEAKPGRAGSADKWFTKLERFVRAGGNLIVTDGAVKSLVKFGVLEDADIRVDKQYVGFVDFGDRSHPLNADLRGVASQTYDTVPIGYRFGGGGNSAPNWKVAQAKWEELGGTTLGTNGSGQTIYGELPLGKGRVRFLGALLPNPSEDYYHPYGLQNYAVTYTGYTLLANMLDHDRPGK